MRQQQQQHQRDSTESQKLPLSRIDRVTRISHLTHVWIAAFWHFEECQNTFWLRSKFLKVKTIRNDSPQKSNIFQPKKLSWILLGNHFLLNERKTRIWPGMWVGVVSFSNMLDPNAWSIVCPRWRHFLSQKAFINLRSRSVTLPDWKTLVSKK